MNPVFIGFDVAGAVLSSPGSADSPVLAPVTELEVVDRGFEILYYAVFPLEQPDLILAEQDDSGALSAVKQVHCRPDHDTALKGDEVFADRDLESVKDIDRAIGTEEKGDAASSLMG